MKRISRRVVPPIKRNGKTFDSLFAGSQTIKKAWDGQDKDAFFRDKYSHVHAKQKFNRMKQSTWIKENFALSSRMDQVKEPRKDFASKLADKMSADSRLEYIYGQNSVLAALETRKVLKAYSGHKSKDLDPEFVASCAEKKVPVESGVPLQHLNILTKNAVHNKYVLETHKREIEIAKEIKEEEFGFKVNGTIYQANRRFPLGLYIDQVTDTHNMGAILRSAYWFGVDFVAFSGRNCAPISPQVVKASAGAAEFLKLFSISQPLALFEQLKQQNWALISSSAQPLPNLTRVEPKDLSKLYGQQPCLLIVGSEGEGIRKSLIQRSSHFTMLTPQNSSHSPLVDSLNVSVATAILLSQFATTV